MILDENENLKLLVEEIGTVLDFSNEVVNLPTLNTENGEV
jgi:hypothetical protein